MKDKTACIYNVQCSACLFYCTFASIMETYSCAIQFFMDKSIIPLERVSFLVSFGPNRSNFCDYFSDKIGL